jgi:hypothetical protein
MVGIQLPDDPLDHDGEQAGGSTEQQRGPCFFPHDVPLSLAPCSGGPQANPDPPPLSSPPSLLPEWMSRHHQILMIFPERKSGNFLLIQAQTAEGK